MIYEVLQVPVIAGFWVLRHRPYILDTRGFPFRMATTNNAKNQLQEIFQKAGQQLPQYDVEREVNGTFRASVTVRWEGREMVAYGTGPRKKAAEMDAAENMLRNIMPRTVGFTYRLC